MFRAVLSLARQLPADPAILEEMLRTGQLHKAQALAAHQPPARELPLSTGVAALDLALGGGLARGHLTEVVAPLSAGGTALLRAALGAATRRGEVCALIDPDDAFDPGGALDGGQPDPARIDLRRLLWVRPASLLLALRAAEIALEARFALVVLDLGERGAEQKAPPPRRGLVPHRAQMSLGEAAAREHLERIDREVLRVRARSVGAPPPGGSPWARLARKAERQGGVVLVVARAPQLGPFSAATVELERRGARWAGQPGTPGRLLCGAAAMGAVVRSKRGMPSASIPLSLEWRAS